MGVVSCKGDKVCIRVSEWHVCGESVSKWKIVRSWSLIGCEPEKGVDRLFAQLGARVKFK